MRIIVVLIVLITLFALLARILPPAYYLPLYCLFLLGGIGYAFWERRRIQTRQIRLEEEYRAKAVEWQSMRWGEEEEE